MCKTDLHEYEKQMSVVIFCGFLIITAVFFPGCSSSIKLSSTWRQGDITIDGNGTEWQRGLYYDKESDIEYSIRNDDDYMYLFMKTQDRTIQMQMMRAGFTIWFDATGGNDHTFGIRYPLPRQGVHTESQFESDDEQKHSAFEQTLLELEIVGAQKEDVQRFSILDIPGVRVKIVRLQETLTYELRVPLKKTSNTPFAIGVTSANRIGIGLETEELNRDKMKTGMHKDEGLNGNESGNFQMGEGEEHDGRSYNAGGHREGARENKQRQEQLRIWLSVQLAHAPDGGK